MKVAVVVSTRNRVQRLPRALEALEASRTCFAGKAELVVIDNGSNDATPAFLAEWVRSGVGRRTQSVPQPGKSRALNTYLADATAELLAFTDDDVDVGVDWLPSMVDFLERRTEYHAATGPIEPPLATVDPDLRRRLAVFGYKLPFRLEGASEHDTELLIGANMVLRRDALARAGGFDERLGAGALGFCEDDELGARLRRHGMRLGYNPRAVVYHDVEVDRLTLDAALQRAVGSARSDLVAYPDRHGVWSSAARLAEVGFAFALARLAGRRERAVRKRILLEYRTEILREILHRSRR